MSARRKQFTNKDKNENKAMAKTRTKTKTKTKTKTDTKKATNPCGYADDLPSRVFSIEILRLASDGSGVGYLDGKATFVPGMLPGEKGTVRITEAKKNYQRAELVSLESVSPERRDPACKVYQECGGCNLQHMDYASTLQWKKRWVEDALARIGGIAHPEKIVQEVIGMEHPWRYRNKAVLHRDERGNYGYYQEKTNEVTEFEDCLLLSESTNERIRRAKQQFRDRKPEIKSITFRENSRGEGLLLLDGVPEEAKHPFAEYLDDLHFRVSPSAFLQVNPRQTAKLYGLVMEWAALTGREEVWDLYCGIGTMTLMLAKRAASVLGIEENPAAIEDAEFNARENKLTNARFICGKVEDRIAELWAQAGLSPGPALSSETEESSGGKLIPTPGHGVVSADTARLVEPEELAMCADSAVPAVPDLVVTDPPRAGMDRKVLELLLRLKPPKIIYVSCNPATLARDLKILTNPPEGESQGVYRIDKVQPVDMFAWSHHVECVTLMSRVEK